VIIAIKLKGRKEKFQRICGLEIMGGGQGETFALAEQTCLKEFDETKGVMLVSPKVYSGDVVVRFKILGLTPATVVAVILSGSDMGESQELSIPENCDGDFSLWYGYKDNYFFVFKNVLHNATPFGRKNALPGEILISANNTMMIAGLYYDIEVGRKKNKLWLSINDELAFEVDDESPLSGGHIALRIRGTAGFKGAGLFKDLMIYSK